MHHSIEISHLSFSYPDGHPALRDVSLIIAPNEKVALVGPNGAGKSTLILHLNGILTGEGSVRICSMEAVKENMGKIRAAVGLVFQNPDDQLFCPTVFDDVAYGPLYQGLSPTEVSRRVELALAAVNMESYAQRVSHHLSAGEKKRISIATVLSVEPEVLILDEPTAGLDPRSRRNFINLIRDLPITMLVSTHDMALVNELFKRTIIMDEGRIVADGNTSDIMSDEVMLTKHGLEKP